MLYFSPCLTKNIAKSIPFLLLKLVIGQNAMSVGWSL